MLTVQHLHKSFSIAGKNLPVLKGISMSVEKGEMIAIVGASGAGKTTLLQVLGTLDRPTSGTVLFSGEDVFARSDHDLSAFRNKQIGFVFQFHHLLPAFTALENVVMPCLISGIAPTKAELSAKLLLDMVGLSERFYHKPGQLSGGEQQRVAIARALVRAPEWVLADEPTGNLDTHTHDDVFELLKRLNRQMGTTFILVTHNEKTALQVDRQLKMVDGKIEASMWRGEDEKLTPIS